MDCSGARVDHATTAQGEDQAAGGDEVSVEAFKEREQGGGENDVDDPPGADSLLERHRGHEPFAGYLVPRGYERDRGHNARVKKDADHDGQPDRAKEALGAEVWAGLFRSLAHRLESGHEIG